MTIVISNSPVTSLTYFLMLESGRSISTIIASMIKMTILVIHSVKNANAAPPLPDKHCNVAGSDNDCDAQKKHEGDDCQRGKHVQHAFADCVKA